MMFIKQLLEQTDADTIVALQTQISNLRDEIKSTDSAHARTAIQDRIRELQQQITQLQDSGTTDHESKRKTQFLNNFKIIGKSLPQMWEEFNSLSKKTDPKTHQNQGTRYFSNVLSQTIETAADSYMKALKDGIVDRETVNQQVRSAWNLDQYFDIRKSRAMPVVPREEKGYNAVLKLSKYLN